jgi:hypothetical protein
MQEKAFLVKAALAETEAWRSSNCSGPDDAALALLRFYGESEDLAELLWNDRPERANLQAMADLMSLWAWRTNDNGSRIHRTLEKWVRESSDEERVWLALHNEAMPFIDHAERIERLAQVQHTFPTLAEQCQKISDETRRMVTLERRGQ